MFVPLKDDNPLKVIRFQTVTLALVVANLIVFLLAGALVQAEFSNAIATGYGVVPVELLHPSIALPVSLNPIPEPATLLSYMFLHGSWMHLLFNMAFLWVFADNIEDAFGHFGFAMFYLLCGIAGALVHALMQPLSPVPMIGASGAVSGVLGAYLLLYPRARIWVVFFLPIPFRIPAVIVLGLWFALQMFNVFAPGPQPEAVAWWAHIGGFVSGMVLTLLLRSRLLVKT